MLWHIHINYIYISFSSSEVKNLWIKKCLKIFDTSPPQDKNKIGTKWQYDLSWSYHLLNQHQRDVWNAGVSFCVDKTCLREPPFPQYTTPRSDREQRRYLDLRCYPQSDLAVPRMQLFFAEYADEIFSSLLSLFFLGGCVYMQVETLGLTKFLERDRYRDTCIQR